jgi:type IV secretory pathway TrbD component
VKALGAWVVVAVAAAVAGTAAADPLPPLPPPPPPPVTVTTPSVPLPSSPVPLPSVPTLPAPVVASPPPAPAQTPSTTSATGSTGAAGSAGSAASSLVSSAAGTVAGSSTSGSGGGAGATGTSASGTSASGNSAAASSGGSRSAGAQGAGGSRVEHFNSSRPWIGTTGPKKRRTTTLTFALSRPTRVIFTVNQVSPSCHGVGHFSVAGRAGLNRVPFRGRVHGRPLEPGTYRISARTASGRVIRRVIIVIVSGAAPSPAELSALRAANACAESGATSSTVASFGAVSTESGAFSPASALAEQQVPTPGAQSQAAGALGAPHGPNLHSGVLASSVEETVRAIRPWLIALLALAIVMLGVASLPGPAVPDNRVNDALVRHRVEIAGLGVAALVAVALAFLLA